MWFEILLVFILFKFKKRHNISRIRVVVYYFCEYIRIYINFYPYYNFLQVQQLQVISMKQDNKKIKDQIMQKRVKILINRRHTEMNKNFMKIKCLKFNFHHSISYT